jgi:8-oxo-dGTP diphosphatase
MAAAWPPRDLTSFSAKEVLASFETPADRVVVGAVVIRASPEGDRLLVLQRSGTAEYGGIEELPSGEVEDGESLGEALLREIQEETGLVADSVGNLVSSFLYHSSKGRTIQYNFLVAVDVDGQVRVDPREHSGFRWISTVGLEESRLTESVKEGLRHL